MTTPSGLPGERRFQVIWWWREWRDWRPWFEVWRPDPDSDWRYIYRWSMTFGPLEVRRWETDLKPGVAP